MLLTPSGSAEWDYRCEVHMGQADEIFGTCEHCKGRFAFPRFDVGRASSCPHCHRSIVLREQRSWFSSTLDAISQRQKRYTMIGADQRAYGPVTARNLRKWIAQGRAAATTSVKIEGSDEFVQLCSLPEFSDAHTATTFTQRPGVSVAQLANLRVLACIRWLRTRCLNLSCVFLFIASLFCCFALLESRPTRFERYCIEMGNLFQMRSRLTSEGKDGIPDEWSAFLYFEFAQREANSRKSRAAWCWPASAVFFLGGLIVLRR